MDNIVYEGDKIFKESKQGHNWPSWKGRWKCIFYWCLMSSEDSVTVLGCAHIHILHTLYFFLMYRHAAREDCVKLLHLVPQELTKTPAWIYISISTLPFFPEKDNSGHQIRWRLLSLELSSIRHKNWDLQFFHLDSKWAGNKSSAYMKEVQACCRDAKLNFSMSVSRGINSQFLFVALSLCMIILKILRGCV